MLLMNIRPATEQDKSSIVVLDADSNPYPWGEGLVVDALITRENWLVEEIEAAEIEGVVECYEPAKRIVGWLTASVLFDQSELELIVVDQVLRRQGLAKKLMSAWLQATAEQGVSEYLLEVRASNLGAIYLYQSLGFECVGQRKNYYQTELGCESACLYRLKKT